jgi:hypothetical protein
METRILRQPWLTLLTHAFFAWVTISFYRSIQQSNQVDHAAVDVYKVYGFFAIALLVIISAWTAIKRKLLAQYFLSGLFLVVNVWLYFIGLNKVQDLPYQQRFILKNDTPYPLTGLTIFGDTTIQIGTLQPNQITTVTYSKYLENSSIDMACNFAQTKDTLSLVSGLTNSIGYMNKVSIKVKDKLKADITK